MSVSVPLLFQFVNNQLIAGPEVNNYCFLLTTL